jgi:hypothetical protein
MSLLALGAVALTTIAPVTEKFIPTVEEEAGAAVVKKLATVPKEGESLEALLTCVNPHKKQKLPISFTGLITNSKLDSFERYCKGPDKTNEVVIDPLPPVLGRFSVIKYALQNIQVNGLNAILNPFVAGLCYGYDTKLEQKIPTLISARRMPEDYAGLTKTELSDKFLTSRLVEECRADLKDKYPHSKTARAIVAITNSSSDSTDRNLIPYRLPEVSQNPPPFLTYLREGARPALRIDTN